jgi:DEAD/DEAH box helicase domain-containing protein
MQKHTSAFWLLFPEGVVSAGPEPRPVIVDALRGLSRAMHLSAAAGLMVDMRDLGRTIGERSGPGAALGTGAAGGFDPTIFLYDTVPGGVGLAQRIFDERDSMLRRARALVGACGCKCGCPACIGPPAGGLLPIEGAPKGRKGVVMRLLHRLGVGATH